MRYFLPFQNPFGTLATTQEKIIIIIGTPISRQEAVADNESPAAYDILLMLCSLFTSYEDNSQQTTKTL